MNALFSKLTTPVHNGLVVTCLTPPHEGSYALFEDGILSLTSSKDLPWSAVADAFSGQSTRIISYDHKDYFCEALSATPHIIICGAGHVSTAIIRFAKLLSFHVTAVDDRLHFVNQALAAGADEGICNNFDDALSSLALSPEFYYIVATRGHRYDKDCLLHILKEQKRYVGIMSSKRRVFLLKRDLMELGITEEIINAVYSPIGLDIASETPEEIALSILAEIVKVKNQTRPSFGFPQEFLDDYQQRPEQMSSALCTVVQRRGSAPRDVGSKMIVTADGTIFNTIGGGCVEAEVRTAALEVIDSGNPILVDKIMTAEDAEDEGMVCGGMVQVFIQPI